MRRLIGVVAVVALLTGCGQDEKAKKPAVPKAEKTYEQLSADDVIVTVNGVPLTKGKLELEIAVQEELTKLTRPNTKISDLERSRAKYRRTAERRFIERRAILDEAKRRGIELTVEDRREIRDRFAKGVLKGRAMYGVLAAKLDEEKRAELDAGLNLDKLSQKVTAALREECRVTVSDADVRAKYRDLESYNAGAKAEEAQIWKNASNVWERIQNGESFEKAAARCTEGNEHVRSDMDWGEFELGFFKDDAELCHFLSVMPVGTVSPPVPGDNGVLIVKLLAKIPSDFSEGRPTPRYRLASIFFELPEVYPLTTQDELRKEMEKVFAEEAFKKRIAALVAAAKVEHPNGKIVMRGGGARNGMGLKLSRGNANKGKDKKGTK